MTSLILRIEGVGHPARSALRPSNTTLDGTISFCTNLPSYAVTGSHWLPCVAGYPDMLSEKINPMGGAVELGSISVEFAEPWSDRLSELFRVSPSPVVLLDSAMTAAATSYTFTDVTWASVDSLFWIGEECMYISAISGSTVTFERGVCGTNPRAHATNEPVFDVCPYVIGRVMTGYWAPHNATSYSDEIQCGQWLVDRITWSQDLLAWVISGSSVSRWLNRITPYKPHNFRSTGMSFMYSTGINFALWENGNTWNGDDSAIVGSNDYAHYYFENADGKEIIGLYGTNMYSGVTLIRRNVAATDPNMDLPEIKPGSFWRQVYVADHHKNDGSFGVVGGGPDNHPIDILLNIMTSSLDSADGYETAGTNDDPTWGDWAVLPAGYGLGIPIGKIDIESFMDVKARTYHVTVSNFVYGSKQTKFYEIANRLLAPLGAFITVDSAGTIVCKLPRMPCTTDTVVDVDSSNLIDVPEMAMEQVLEGGSIRVLFAHDSEVSIESAYFKTHYAKVGIYQASNDTVDLDMRWAYHSLGMWAELIAARKFFRWAFPVAVVNVNVSEDPDFAEVGDYVALTVDELPNMRTGVRGCDGDYFQVLNRESQFDNGRTRQHLTLYRYSDRKVGTIAPSADINSVATNTVTVSANRYTCSNAIDDLPNKDCDAFEVGDIVKIVDRAGASASASTQTVSSINSGANTITLDGNFGGALAAGQVLEISTATSSNPRISECAWIGSADGDVGSAVKDCDIWGEL